MFATLLNQHIYSCLPLIYDYFIKTKDNDSYSQFLAGKIELGIVGKMLVY